MRILIIISLLAITFSSCITAKKVLENPQMFGLVRILDLKDSNVVEFTSDTILDIGQVDWSHADSTSIKLYLECDSNNNVLLNKVIELQNTGKKVIYKYKLTDNTLTLETIVAELRRIIEVKNEIINRKISIIKVAVPYPVFKDKTPIYVHILWGIGAIILLIVGIFIGKFIGRKL